MCLCTNNCLWCGFVFQPCCYSWQIKINILIFCTGFLKISYVNTVLDMFLKYIMLFLWLSSLIIAHVHITDVLDVHRRYAVQPRFSAPWAHPQRATYVRHAGNIRGNHARWAQPLPGAQGQGPGFGVRWWRVQTAKVIIGDSEHQLC